MSEFALPATIFLPPLIAILLSYNIPLAGFISTATALLIVSHTVPDILRGLEPAFTVSWIESLGISFSLKMDSLSFILLVVSNLVFTVLSLFLGGRARFQLFAFTTIQLAFNGALLAQDLFLFYCFFELLIFPIYILMLSHLYTVDRSTRYIFAIYTIMGSLFLLGGILYLANDFKFTYGYYSFALDDLQKLSFTFAKEKILFLVFIIAFAVKAPLFPFHSWLPRTYTRVSLYLAVILAGILFQLGVYGIYRFVFALFPNAAEYFAFSFSVLAVIGIIYGALLAWRSETIKEIFAYASISHVSFSLLGLFVNTELGYVAGFYLVVAHILVAAGLFFIAHFIEKRFGDNPVCAIVQDYPKLAIFCFLFALASVSFPLTIGFVGELLVIKSAYETFPLLAFFALFGVILSVVYMFTFLKKFVFSSPPAGQGVRNSLTIDLDFFETLALSLIFVLILFWGVFANNLFLFLSF